MIKEEPGKFPYTRGIYSEMYKKKLWTMRQYAGFTSASDSNKRYRIQLSAIKWEKISAKNRKNSHFMA